MLNGGYYADYASIMGTIGLSTMHHSTWDNLVSWVGPHVDRLANWSCEQVRADIEKRGGRSQWMAGFDGFYLTRGHHSNNSNNYFLNYIGEIPYSAKLWRGRI